MPHVRLLLIGFGNVGQALARILLEKEKYPGLSGLDASVVGTVTATRGSLSASSGLDLGPALAAMKEHGRFLPTTPGYSELGSMRAIQTLEYDVLVELSTLSVSNRGEPAVSHLRAALSRGKHVITCNKGPIAWAYRELSALASSRGVSLLHEGTVMDGVPVFNLARHGLRGNTITRLEGVLNSTTNIVLCAMERGVSLPDAVRLAQEEGVAEADPANDLRGWDGAVKLAALGNVLMAADLTPEQVFREEVTEAASIRARQALAGGMRLKALCRAERDGATVRASVSLREVPPEHPFYRLRGPGSALRISTDILGTFTIGEESPDLHTTAYAVISDLFSLQNRALAI